MNWMFIDMNSYFASVEQHFRPELRGRPVGVIPLESEFTCVIAASHLAKKQGVRVGTKVADARRLCPGIAFVRARPNLYVKVHHELLRSVDQCAPVHKVYSIDEWSIKLMGHEKNRAGAMELGRQVKAQMRKDFGEILTCSIGIAPTRLMAKIASDLQKPDGLVALDVEDLPERIEHLALTDLCGIGRAMCARLHAGGVHNVRDLWNLSRRDSVRLWNSAVGGDWWAGLHGVDEPEIPTRRSSMSHENVLDPKFRTEVGAHGVMVRLLCRLGVRLRHDGFAARMLRAKIRHQDGSAWYAECELAQVQDTPTLLEKFDLLWRRRPPGAEKPKKVGVEVSGLVLMSQVSGMLFAENQRPLRMSEAIDKINLKWGWSTIYFGVMHDFRHSMDDKIAFGRIPPVCKG